MEPLVSIIVPVFNAEPWLTRCITSILAQTFVDFELILINDGSTDGSLSILRDFSTKDSRIRIIDQSNSGVSATRNIGLKHSKGTWITFIDADDWIERTYLEHLLQDIESDFRMSLFWVEMNDGTSLCRQARKTFDKPLSIQDTLNEANDILWNICSKLYRRDIIDKYNIYFNERLSLGEDTFFNYHYLSNCKSCILCKNHDYHYMQTNQNSLSKSNLTYHNLETFIDESSKLVILFNSKNEFINFQNCQSILRLFCLKNIIFLPNDFSKIKSILAKPFISSDIKINKKDGKKLMIFNILLKIHMYKIAYTFLKRITL